MRNNSDGETETAPRGAVWILHGARIGYSIRGVIAYSGVWSGVRGSLAGGASRGRGCLGGGGFGFRILGGFFGGGLGGGFGGGAPPACPACADSLHYQTHLGAEFGHADFTPHTLPHRAFT